MNRYETANKVGIIGVIGNVFLFIIKISLGLFSKSQSMIADAINSASDIFASLMTWLGSKISSVPNDKEHNFGHGKAEYIFSMIISISMIFLSLKLLLNAVVSIIENKQLLFSWLLIGVCLITILVKGILFIYTKSLYKKSNNLLIKANMIDHRNDSIITLFTTVAILFSRIGIFWLDGVVGIIISLWILIVGVKLFQDSYNVLMDSAIDDESKNKILEVIKSDNEVKRIGTLYSIPVGYQYIVVVTIYVDGSLSTMNSHKIADNLEKIISKKVDNINKVIIHVEPFLH